MSQTTNLCLCLVLLAAAGMLLSPVAAAQNAEALYTNHCAKCHGNDGSAKTNAGRKLKIIDLRSETVQKQSDDELFSSIAHGVRHKEYPHAFAHRGLSDANILQLVEHIRQLPKAK